MMTYPYLPFIPSSAAFHTKLTHKPLTMPPVTPNPLSSLKVSSHQIPAHGATPNTSIQCKPLLIYHAAFPSTITASQLEAHFARVGAALPQWRYTMYATSHFHSTTHEVLGVAAGAARLCFGHEANAGRVEVEARRGDVLVVPAGVAHRLLRDHLDEDESFGMVGAYPPGCSWDMCYGRAGEEEKVQGIRAVKWFERDPVYGDEGPVLDARYR